MVNVSRRDTSRKMTLSGFLGVGGMPTAVPTAARKLENDWQFWSPLHSCSLGTFPKVLVLAFLFTWCQLLTRHSLLTSLLGHLDRKPPGHVSLPPSAVKPPFPGESMADSVPLQPLHPHANSPALTFLQLNCSWPQSLGHS